MCLGALVDAGVPLEYLIEKLKKLGLGQEYQLRAESVHRQGQLATKIHVDVFLPEHHHHHHPPHRHLPEIEQIIESADLPPRASEWSLSVFRRLAVAEGAVHGVPPTQVHFHEVGATDAIVDIVGTCLGLDRLGIDQIYCSALPTGGGTIRAAHGQLPVPVPAVLKLWESRQVPVYSNGIDKELVTPTGAAIAVTLAHSFGSPPPMRVDRLGLGAGSIELPIPNILRLWMGEPVGADCRGGFSQSGIGQTFNVGSNPPASEEIETIALLETQIDDLSPQAIGYVFDALFAAGAVDVFTQAIGMKKSRPGVLLTVICPPEKISACESVLFRETTTLGIRRSTQQRSILPREIQQVETQYGAVRVKVAMSGEQTILNVQPEYEDCAQLARENRVPWREIHRLALQKWYAEHQ